MKKSIKSLFICILMFSFLVALLGCNSSKEDEYSKIQDEYSIKSQEFKKNLDEIISSRIVEYSKSYGVLGDLSFESHKVYGMETKEDKLYIYLTSFVSDFTFEGDKIKTRFVDCVPVRLILNSDDYKFVDYSIPMEGMDFDEALKDLFPEKYHKIVKKYRDDYHKLYTENRSKLINWLKENRKNEDLVIEDI
ncbi:hypothetical protein OR62_07990 [Clostridium tetani]|uniref:DUF4230 domain-containing protein n=1 Tax=Clostridium tetani TaxID=1513 RepID=A0ABY0EM42_CLOTA|nr:hypothetical protein [Clostridium tetani]KHO39068.1 hypothetical protein OR62_07990 [Clostridium tetani]RXI38086.1 hypothetical protein DP129_12095 [Clostridium tetani]RXI52358.1 hypothetical protein DP131_12530 [Clostridium tetani]RXI69997.1 hypothetical protein DQN76_07220 [Clostridium tetani]